VVTALVVDRGNLLPCLFLILVCGR